MSYERTVDIDKGIIDLDTGEFPMTLATNGEASDGHILEPRGGEMGDKLPMLFGHKSVLEAPTLGRITDFSVEERDGFDHLRGKGKMNLKGDPERDALVGIRIGIAQLMHDGDLDGMSIRWDPVGKPVPRNSLPGDHYAYASRDTDGPGAYGMYFEKFRGLEGSVVGLGADPKALVGRADNASSDLERTFWRSVADSAASDVDSVGNIISAFKLIKDGCDQLRTRGLQDVNIAQILSYVLDDESVPTHAFRYGDKVLYLPLDAWQEIYEDSRSELRAALKLYSDMSREIPEDVSGRVESTESLEHEAPLDVELVKGAVNRALESMLPTWADTRKARIERVTKEVARKMTDRKMGKLT